MSKFSVFLKELLTQSGEPIARIAKNAGLERTSIHKALKDERILSYSALRQLIQYLQLTLPQVRELNQYYEMLLQGEETYHTRKQSANFYRIYPSFIFPRRSRRSFKGTGQSHTGAFASKRPDLWQAAD